MRSSRVAVVGLTLAAAYNAAFGAWAVLLPNSFFALFGLEPPRYPSIWQTLGLVLGLYGVLYAYAARHLDRARPIVVVGLLGKILGPVGWILTVSRGDLPVRTFPLIVFNDLVWWLPFAWYLVDGTAIARALRVATTKICGALNLAAFLGLAGLVALSGGAVSDPQAGPAFIQDHIVAWRAVWLLWMVAAISLLALFFWWSARLAPSRIISVALTLAVVGVAVDLGADSLYVSWLPERADLVPLAALASAAGANGLYAAAGAILTARTASLNGLALGWTWAIWGAGGALALSAIGQSSIGSAVSSAVLFALFCPWCFFVAPRIGAAARS